MIGQKKWPRKKNIKQIKTKDKLKTKKLKKKMKIISHNVLKLSKNPKTYSANALIGLVEKNDTVKKSDKKKNNINLQKTKNKNNLKNDKY